MRRRDRASDGAVAGRRHGDDRVDLTADLRPQAGTRFDKGPLVTVEPDALLVAETTGGITLPVGGVCEGQSLLQAARKVMRDEHLPSLRRVVVDQVQMRRRKVITHVLATAPFSRDTVTRLVYRDPRVELRIMTMDNVLERIPPQGRLRLLLGLDALNVGGTIFMDNGVVRHRV